MTLGLGLLWVLHIVGHLETWSLEWWTAVVGSIMVAWDVETIKRNAKKDKG